jgi:hypothetical protein
VVNDKLKQETIKVLEDIINKACHPDIALRVVMVELAPIRKMLKKLKDESLHQP